MYLEIFLYVLCVGLSLGISIVAFMFLWHVLIWVLDKLEI